MKGPLTKSIIFLLNHCLFKPLNFDPSYRYHFTNNQQHYQYYRSDLNNYVNG